MQLPTLIYHWADQVLPIKPAYHKHPLKEGVLLTVWGAVLLILAGTVRGIPEEISYLVRGWRAPDFNHPVLFALELLLVSIAISYVTGRWAAGRVAWFRHHVSYKRPIRSARRLLGRIRPISLAKRHVKA